ncbi:MAG: glycerate kinase [Actinomycetota bacterium]
MTPRTIVVAPDSFKGSATAVEVAEAIATGWRSVHDTDDLLLRPMADGGEGTLDAFELAVPGSRRVPAAGAYYLLLPGGTAVVELANTCGLTLMKQLDPMGATTARFGEAIAHALDHGADRLVLGIGGSASTDGGMGALAEIGLRAVPSRGATVLTDVTNPLFGPTGAAAVFGPQKGASPEQVALLDQRLRDLAAEFGVDPSTPGAGAAGGTGYGMLTWGATLEAGSRTVAELIDLPGALKGADLLITGEGRFDSQSLDGKVISHLLELAGEVPVALIAGRIDAPVDDFAASISLVELAGGAEAAMSDPLRWIAAAARTLALRA